MRPVRRGSPDPTETTDRRSPLPPFCHFNFETGREPALLLRSGNFLRIRTDSPHHKHLLRNVREMRRLRNFTVEWATHLSIELANVSTQRYHNHADQQSMFLGHVLAVLTNFNKSISPSMNWRRMTGALHRRFV